MLYKLPKNLSFILIMFSTNLNAAARSKQEKDPKKEEGDIMFKIRKSCYNLHINVTFLIVKDSYEY